MPARGHLVIQLHKPGHGGRPRRAADGVRTGDADLIDQLGCAVLGEVDQTVTIPCHIAEIGVCDGGGVGERVEWSRRTIEAVVEPWPPEETAGDGGGVRLLDGGRGGGAGAGRAGVPGVRQPCEAHGVAGLRGMCIAQRSTLREGPCGHEYGGGVGDACGENDPRALQR